MGRERVRQSRRWVRRATGLVVAWVALTLPLAAARAAPPGVRLDFDQLLERQELRQHGMLLVIGPSARLRAESFDGEVLRQELQYSPTTGLVFDVRAPGFLPGPPEYYLYDGAYFVYEPRDYSAPYLRITALAPSAQQDQLLGENHAWALAHLRAQNVGSQAQVGGGQGFEVTVVNSLPGPLSTMFGRDATTIRVTGRESISFAGESRRVSPYIASEQGRGQSLFPRLDMDQDLQVKLEGTIGGKVHVAVDHNSSAFGVDANRVNVWYEGYEDDIIRRIDLGGTNMAMPGSRLVAPPGFSQGVFGVKTDLRLAGLDLTVLAAKEETEAETRTLTPSGGSATVVPLEERNYVRNRFFFYELPDTTRFYYSYGLDPGSQDGNTLGQLIEQAAAPRFRVYIDDNNGFVESRNLLGYAVANLPAGLDTVAMNATFNSTPNTARWPTQDPGVNIYDPNYRVGHWRILQAGTDFGWVFFDANGKKLVLGLYLLNGSLNPNAALAVSFDDPQGKKVGSTDPEVKPKLRLLHHPDQDADFYGHPTSLLMMRHVYYLGTTGIQDLELSIETQVPGDLTPAAPDNLPQSTYLHMFGLDELDQANRPGPDGLFDTHRANLLDEDNGFLFMPGLRPFSPPEDIVVRRLIDAGVPEDSALTDRERLFGSAEVVDSRLYTLKDTDQTLPTNHYRLLVTTRGTETQIVLQQDIIEGSDVVRLDGRTLVRGVDYDIEPVAGGKITFKGQVLNEISPSSRIEVSYAFRPLLGTGQATLLGMSGKYDFGPRGYLAALALWESRRSFSRQPQLGDEPSRNLVGDVNLNLRFQPGFLTRLADLLPFTRTNAASSIAMAAEVAVSKPDPNTKNTAFVEDMESSDTSDRVASSREAWSWAALPDPTAAPVDTLNRIPTYYYNPTGRVKRGHLNPTLPEDEANDGLTVLELGFDRDQVTNLLTSEPFRGPLLWAGVESAFPGNGLDLSQTRTLEFWLNDGIADPTGRRGRMHIDFGDISEDFVFFPNNPNRPGGGGPLSQPNFNREAETPFQFIATTDDMGWNGKQDDCPPPSSERYPRGSDCHRPDHYVPATGQYPFANGTELDNRYDSEDINGDGVWDTKNSFFRVDLNLADLTYIDPGTDISPTYANDPNIDPKLKPGFQGWRHYRIDFQSLLRDSLYEIVVGPGERPPQLTQVRYLRIWFDDPQAPTDPTQQLWSLYNYQLFDFKFTGNQWLQLGVHGTDASRLDPQPFDEIYTVSVINNKDNPEYTIPPDADLVDTAGVQAREQALRLVFDNLKPGHEMVAQKTNPLGRPTDYTLYNRMNFFTNLESDFADSVEVFFRMGSDSLNFYEVARPLLGVRGWQETIFDLRTLTDLKFPEDVGAPVDTLTLGGRPVVQVRRFVQDIANPSVTLKITRRGNPSLKQVSRHFVGVRHLRPASDLGAAPVSGDFWFNNVRLEDPKREVGTAQIYGVQGNVADVFDFNATLSTRDADFLGLRQRTGTGSDLYNFQNSYKIPDVSRLIPTLGLTIPLSYTLARDVSRPKFSTSSDTENDAVRADEQRTESVRRGFGLSLQKKPSKFFLFKPTLDRLTFAYNESHTERRSFTSRDTSASWSQNLNYDLSPKARNIPLFFRQQLNLLPTNVKFGAQHQNSRSLIYTSSGSSGGSLQPRPVVSARSFNWNAAAAMRPLQMLNVQYSFNESRDYREAHPDNEEERVRLGSFDFGIPTGRGEGISLDLSPRLFQYSYSANYADRRTVQVEQTTGAPRPDVHQLLSGRTHRVNFDFKLHRRLASLFGGAPRPVVPPGSGEMPEGERQFGGAEEGAEPPPPQGGPGEPPPPQQQQPPPGPGAPGSPPGQQAPPESLQAAPPPRRLPNPLRPLFRFIGGIDAVKVEASDSRSASYVGAPQEANYMYRFGFSTDTGIPGYSEPSPVNTTRTLNLNTAVPLRGALRVTLRYGLRANDIESRSGQDALLRMNVDSSRETNFPSAELSINDLQKLRIFGSKLQRSTLTMGYNRTASERFSQDTDAVGTETQSNRRESSTTLITANWTGQWSGGTATTLALNQTSGEEETVGQRTTNTRRAITGTMRFKVAPKGGLRLPFIGALKTGLDVQLNGSYNRDSGELFNNPDDPSVSIPQRQTSAIAAGARGDFTLSRSMTSGVEMGYTRSRDEKNNQTVSTFRLGFNLTFLF